MFANFKDIVKKESIEKIPTEIINAYNSKIPNGIGLKYVDNNDGKCILIPDKPKEKIDMTITMPPSNLVDKIPDDIKTQKDLLDYMYRTQKTLYYEIDENSVLINGEPSYQSIEMMIAVNGRANSKIGEDMLNKARKDYPPEYMKDYYYLREKVIKKKYMSYQKSGKH